MQTTIDAWTDAFDGPRDAASRFEDMALRSRSDEAAKYRRWARELLNEAEKQEMVVSAQQLAVVAVRGER